MVMGWPERPRILHSYAYTNGQKWPVPFPADTIIDSGAFTAHTTGKRIDMGAYAEFLREHAPRITFAFNLDVIGDAAGSARNHDRLRSLVGDRVQIVPTWHVGSPWEEFERLCREDDYVSLGGAVGLPTRQLMQYSIKAHRIAAKHGTRLHGLGITSNDLLLRLPWASVDSSSYMYPARYPMVILPDRRGHMVYGKTGQRPKPHEAAVLRDYGIPVSLVRPQFADLKRDQPDLARTRSTTLKRASARGYMYAETVRRLKHPTFRLYLVTTAVETDPPLVREAWELGNPYT